MKIDTKDLRAAILDQPGLILNDAQIMSALFGLPPNDSGNIVDLNARAATAMATHLARLDEAAQDTAQTAHANHLAARTIHQAVLHLLDEPNWPGFITSLGPSLAKMLDVFATRLIIETDAPGHWPRLPTVDETLINVPPGFCSAYLGDQPNPPVLLRQIQRGLPEIYGPAAPQIKSEAILDLGRTDADYRLLFTMASRDETQFNPAFGTDMLEFFRAILQRIIPRLTE